MMRTILSFSLLAAIPAAGQTAVAPIRMNQVGYLPDAPKFAMYVSPDAAKEFQVLAADSGKQVFRGVPGEPAADALSGDTVQVLDFSRLTRRGRYVLAVGGQKTAPFEIGKDVYRRAYYLAMRSFYGQRCGTKVDLGPEFPGFRYEACHLEGQFHASSGLSGAAPSTKGWHDAGDYGRYIVNSGITTGTLLWAWELYKPKATLQIPESGGKTPDLLAEIRWNLDWMLTMQAPSGGVYHKQTTARFSGFVMPDKDTMPSVVIGTGKAPFVSTCASADFAAVMAIAGRVYQPYDAPFAAKALAAAKSAFAWAQQNPAVLFSNPQGVSTGAYGDRSCADELVWAAAELARSTGESGYKDFFRANHEPLLKSLAVPPSWGNVGSLGLWSYALGFPKESEQIRQQTLAAAAEIRQRTAAAPYRLAMKTEDYVWGSNAVAANYGVLLLAGHEFDPRQGLRDAALEQLHYLLGRNTFGTSWVSGVGTKSFKNPHHRPSGADANAEPWPGLLSGGPNRRAQDALMRKLPTGLPPMKMWVDEQESYASNENAINWNAALVFVLASAQ